jgi:hypothetical protein
MDFDFEVLPQIRHRIWYIANILQMWIVRKLGNISKCFKPDNQILKSKAKANLT